jgi:hypothetical protein
MMMMMNKTMISPPHNPFYLEFSFHSSHVASQPFITHCHPAGIEPGRPVVTIPVGVAPVPATPVLKLDWDQDP